MYNKRIPINTFTGSKQVFDAVTKGRKTTRKRLMIDVLASCETYRRFEIRRTGLLPENQNLADSLSNLKENLVHGRIIASRIDDI